MRIKAVLTLAAVACNVPSLVNARTHHALKGKIIRKTYSKNTRHLHKKSKTDSPTLSPTVSPTEKPKGKHSKTKKPTPSPTLSPSNAERPSGGGGSGGIDIVVDVSGNNNIVDVNIGINKSNFDSEDNGVDDKYDTPSDDYHPDGDYYHPAGDDYHPDGDDYTDYTYTYDAGVDAIITDDVTDEQGDDPSDKTDDTTVKTVDDIPSDLRGLAKSPAMTVDRGPYTVEGTNSAEGQSGGRRQLRNVARPV